MRGSRIDFRVQGNVQAADNVSGGSTRKSTAARDGLAMRTLSGPQLDTLWIPPSSVVEGQVLDPTFLVQEESAHHGQGSPHPLSKVFLRTRASFPDLQACKMPHVTHKVVLACFSPLSQGA